MNICSCKSYFKSKEKMNSLLHILFMPILLNSVSNASPSCSMINIGGKSYYFEEDIKTSWFRANKFCRRHDMQLLTIYPESPEFEELQSFLENNSTFQELTFWMAASNIGTPEEFYWITTGKKFPRSYVDYGQTNCEQLCVSISSSNREITQSDNLLMSYCCLDQHYFICEKITCK